MNESQMIYVIQYDGLSYGEHTIDLASLGESLQGFSKVLACIGHFVATGQYNRRYSSLGVRVSTTANLEKGCIEIPVIISEYSAQIFSGFGGAVLTAIVSYVISRRGKAEMEHLAKALEQSLNQNKELQDRLLSTIDKMADGLVSANRQALSPIGTACQTISILEEDRKTSVMSADKKLKEFFSEAQTQAIEDERVYSGVISELDRLTGTCKVAMEGDDIDDRVNGLITDPSLSMIENEYVKAFSSGQVLKFKAKAKLNSDGDIVRLYISDTIKE